MNQVLETYGTYPELQRPLLLVLGPLMPSEERERIRGRAKPFPQASVIEFDNRMEGLIDGAKAIVSMGGYNTFCEILSFDKRALLVPRVRPREEQLIRARRAADLGILDMLEPTEAADPAKLAAALRRVYERPRPSECERALELGGLAAICDLVDRWLARDSHRRLIAVEGGL
jgi:predicted glycosyltransferase